MKDQPIRIPVVLDCDPGHDDAFAILLAAANPRLELLSITTVAGNQTVDKTTLNARRVCTTAGIADVPIAAGLARPMHAELIVASDVHGDSGLDGPSFGEPTVPVAPVDAITQLHQVITSHGRPVTIVATAPLTNIATLLLAHPDVVEHIERIVLMAGSAGRGNVMPYAEFNVYTDPEAAAIVLGSGLDVTMCGLDVTHQALATPDVVARLSTLGTPLATLCVELIAFFGRTYQDLFGFAAPPIHDPVAVAMVIDPTIVRTVDAAVRVELTGTHTRGATVVDLHGKTGLPADTHVALELDAPRFWDLMIEAIATLGAGNRPI